MEICINEMLYAFSNTLDSVEKELLGCESYHSQRVAYICIELGKALGYSKYELSDLAACAILHDNALNEYIQEEYENGINIFARSDRPHFGNHCIIGEKNICHIPTFRNVRGAVLFHHENADGSGIFGKTSDETPEYAQLIHLGDEIDVMFKLGIYSGDKYREIVSFLKEQTDVLYAKKYVDLFLEIFDDAHLKKIYDTGIDNLLSNALPSFYSTYDRSQIEGFASLFAKIIDYKSNFTKTHSIGVAQKVKIMAKFYDFDEDHATKIYFAGAIHDLGKLLVENKVLEKPDKLTSNEFEIMKKHVSYSSDIISKVKGLEEIGIWISRHHEKINGSGYPMGIKGDKLDFVERLLACVDIYQALIEDRPYRAGMDHNKAVAILKDMASKDEIDKRIVEDIDKIFMNMSSVCFTTK